MDRSATMVILLTLGLTIGSGGILAWFVVDSNDGEGQIIIKGSDCTDLKTDQTFTFNAYNPNDKPIPANSIGINAVNGMALEVSHDEIPVQRNGKITATHTGAIEERNVLFEIIYKNSYMRYLVVC